MQLTSKISKHMLICVLLTITSCSSGGGSDSGDGKGGGGRTSKTGIRVVHTAIDAVPIGIFQNGVFVTKASYLESNDYVPITEGISSFKVTRGSRINEVIKDIGIQALPDTEYTLLLLGQGQDDSVDAELVSEPILRPAKGLGRIRFLNALVGANNASAAVTDGVTSNSLSSAYGVISEPVEVVTGVKSITVTSSNGDRKNLSLELADRGEWLIILAGKSDLGFSTLNVLTDLD